MNRNVLLILHTASLILLGFGWTLDILHIDINLQKHFIIDLNVNLFNEKRSVLGTLRSLLNSGNIAPFLLILLFGIIIPLVKSGVIYYLLISKMPQRRWLNFVTAISKWAMADVFAISILVAFLGANAMESTRATLEPGFYYFAGYVLISALIAVYVAKMLTNQANLKA